MVTETELLRRARDETGLDGFGEDTFREGLAVLLRSAEAEARFTPRGRAAFEAQLVGNLANRLRVEDWYRRHPEIDEQQVIAPLIGLGLPRTGSTALSHLLGEDRHARSLRTWESMAPCPPPDPATAADDPRVVAAEAAMARRAALYPRMVQMLPSTATSPTECQLFMAYDFKSQIFQAFARLPSYVEWLNGEADLVSTYRYVKRVLKLLQWRWPAPVRWRLKNPSHALFIDALDAVFPDARYWMTHRDVAAVVPSVADLYAELHAAGSDAVDRRELGALAADFCELGMRRTIAFRARGHDDRFFDVPFAAFMRDPFPLLERLYAFLGETLTPDTRARMAAWRDATPPDKHGGHRYDPADFGLDPDALRERFRFYSDRFGVAPARAA